ncbi:MAG: fluoride efflux transporter CrcB [Cytophagales bacterium]|nr:fluoride efflux transporter CrcB [Cytophagales bacterium]MCA6372055.1 fluoride efflux transporter CrcB [Cytophagales bacterium]MCA6375767.1 fluoride efflux transporter CrcB [Cytophagales bacterium]MCA6385633.1 fluoride efflux transporter CrcB [Cytophagales bacterium]
MLLIFVGGGIGSVMRFSLGTWISSFHSHHFPYGTLFVNVLACFVLGTLVGVADHKQIISPNARLFWTVGFCGGFSTFSTFSSETLTLIQNGFPFSGLVYVLASLLLCLAATYLGLYLGEQIN